MHGIASADAAAGLARGPTDPAENQRRGSKASLGHGSAFSRAPSAIDFINSFCALTKDSIS